MKTSERFWEKVDEFEDGLPFVTAKGEIPAWIALASGFFASIFLMAKMLTGVEAGLMIALVACFLLTMAAAGFLLAVGVFRMLFGDEPFIGEDDWEDFEGEPGAR